MEGAAVDITQILWKELPVRSGWPPGLADTITIVVLTGAVLSYPAGRGPESEERARVVCYWSLLCPAIMIHLMRIVRFEFRFDLGLI